MDFVIQRQRSFARWASSAFYLAFGAGLTSFLVGWVAATVVSKALPTQSPQLYWLIILLCARFPIISLATLPLARLQIGLRFRTIAMVASVTAIADFGFRVAFASNGWGAYALVMGQLLATSLQTIALFGAAPFLPRLNISLRLWRYIIPDSLRILVATGCNRIVENGDYLLLAMFAPASVVGIYYFAYTMAVQAMYLFVGGLINVAYPTLVKLHHDKHRQRLAYLKMTSVLCCLIFPLCFLQSALTRPVVTLLFEPRWASAIPCIEILSLGIAFRAVAVPAVLLAKARGDFRLFMFLNICSAGTLLMCAALGVLANDYLGMAYGVAIYNGINAIMATVLTLRDAGGIVRVAHLVVGPLLSSVAALLGVVSVGSLVPQITPLMFCVLGSIIFVTVYTLLMLVVADRMLRTSCRTVLLPKFLYGSTAD